MHALSGRVALDEEDYRPDAARWGRDRRSENAENHWRQHRRPNDLRIWRSLRLADAELRREISGRICCLWPKVRPAAFASRRNPRRIDQPGNNPDISPRPRSRLGKSRRRLGDLET